MPSLPVVPIRDYRSPHAVGLTIKNLFAMFESYQPILDRNSNINLPLINSIELIPLFNDTSKTFRTTKFGCMQIDWGSDGSFPEAENNRQATTVDLLGQNRVIGVQEKPARVRLLRQTKVIHVIMAEFLKVLNLSELPNNSLTAVENSDNMSTGSSRVIDVTDVSSTNGVHEDAIMAGQSSSSKSESEDTANWTSISQNTFMSFGSLLVQDRATNVAFHNIFRTMKYNHIRMHILNHFDQKTQRFYILRGKYCFDLNTIKTQLLFNYDTKGEEYYKSLETYAHIVTKWPKKLLLVIRFHFVTKVVAAAYEKYFRYPPVMGGHGSNGGMSDGGHSTSSFPGGQDHKFMHDKFLINSIKKVLSCAPYSDFMIKKLGLSEQADGLYEFLKVAEEINLFSLSDTIMRQLSAMDNF